MIKFVIVWLKSSESFYKRMMAMTMMLLWWRATTTASISARPTIRSSAQKYKEGVECFDQKNCPLEKHDKCKIYPLTWGTTKIGMWQKLPVTSNDRIRFMSLRRQWPTSFTLPRCPWPTRPKVPHGHPSTLNQDSHSSGSTIWVKLPNLLDQEDMD